MADWLSTSRKLTALTLPVFLALNSASQTPKRPADWGKLRQENGLLADQTPFWKTKKKVIARLREREILVSVTTDERQEKGKELKQLFMKGVGWVDTPFLRVKQRIHRFADLKTLAPDHFKEISYSPENDRLFVHGVAMGWHARMHMQLYRRDVDADTYQLHWKVLRGSFRGLTGFFELDEKREDGGRRKVEFSMTAFYESEKLPLPSFLLRFGLESVLRVVAGRMRGYLEKHRPKEKKIEKNR